jgi:hypothetical protein
MSAMLCKIRPRRKSAGSGLFPLPAKEIFLKLLAEFRPIALSQFENS